MKSKKIIVIWRIIQIGMILLTVLGSLKGIFISLDIDESYAIAQGYRVAVGERLLVDMWEPHQLSAFACALFIKIYLWVFNTTDYLVVYLRVAGMLIHTGLGLWMYKVLKENVNSKLLFLLVLLHMNFFPKWVQVPEFEVMHYWFLVATFLVLYPYFMQKKKHGLRPFVAGVCLVGSMMSYPTMILVYPVYFIGLPTLERGYFGVKGIKKFSSIFWMTLGALISGGSFCAYLLSYQTVGELIQNISYIFMDESHTTYTLAEKFSEYLKQIKAMWEIYRVNLNISIAIVAVVLLLIFIVNRIKGSKINLDLKKKLELIFISILLIAAIIMQKDFAWGCLLEDQNQFYLQLRYMSIIIPAIYLGIRYYRKMAVYFYLCVMPAFMSLFAVLLITNMDINTTYAKAMLAVLGTFLMLEVYWCEEIAEHQIGVQIITYTLGISLLIGFFICRVLLIRVTGCLPVTINAPMERMEYGPEKGIYILDEQAEIWNENYPLLEELIGEEDKLLYIGAENLIYPALGSYVSTPSTQGTTVFNDMFLEYYKKNPDKLPDVIVMDKTFGTNPVYGLFSNTDFIMSWIEDNYPDAKEYETTYMKILFLNE